MKISLNWLNDYIDLKDYYSKPEELDRILTDAGLEVEGFENQGAAYKFIKVGQVKLLEKHPDADKLTICQVDIGEKELQTIVCGAKNHKQGDFVVAALPGAVLPGDFKIKESKIRGQKSSGMMCSEKELGLAEESPGIMILPKDSPVGKDFSEYYNLNDVIFEVNVTPNRADCLSHWGLARELSCLLDRKCELPKSNFKPVKKSTKKQIDFQLKNSDLCPRYSGRSIFKVKVGPTPIWMKQRLESVEINSINNVVDVTNYILMELGQPLHAFDVSKVTDKKILVDSSKPKEKFQTLDATEFELTGDELVIRDGEKPVALAGVVGGLNSGVEESTTELFIESAYFKQEAVRRTSRKFGIETDSSYRFSRGTDPEGVVLALERACQLISEVAGGEVAEDFYDEYPQPLQRSEIQISKSFLEEKLGYQVEDKSFTGWMKRLGCEIQGDKKSWQVKAPSFRWDLNDDVDLIEEYARLNGYDQIPEVLPALKETPTAHADLFFQSNLVQRLLKEEGLSQAMNYHFTSSKWCQEFLGSELKNSLPIKNPLNEDLDIMRPELLPSLMKNLLHNYRHGNETGRLYELGSIFRKDEDQYIEEQQLSFLLWGQKDSVWQKDQDRAVVYDLKRHVENVLTKLGCSSWDWRDVENAPEYYHPGQCASLFLEGKTLGQIGSLHPKWQEEFKIRTTVALANFNFDQLMKNHPRKFKFKALSKFPMVERDLAFLVPDTVTSGQIVKEIQKAAKPLLRSVEVFDIYEGKNLPENHKSMAFKLLLQDEKATLEEKGLQELQDKVIAAVEKKLGVKVR